MTNLEAVISLICEARNDRCSTTAARRVVTAAKTLGFNQTETVELLFRLDYCDPDGNPYSLKTQKVW